MEGAPLGPALLENDTSHPTAEEDVAPPTAHDTRSVTARDPPFFDESADTPSKTSTRLVKFQLFETKAVASPIALVLTLSSVSTSSAPTRTKRTTASSKSIALSDREN
jgi:hypothetical protein